MNRATISLSAALAVSSLLMLSPLVVSAADSSGGMSAPAQTDNQMNNTGSNMQNTNNNAGAAAGNNGGTIDNAVNSAADATKSAGDKLRNSADAAGAGTPTADNPAPDAKDIRKTVGKVASLAFTKDDLDDLVGYFSDSDRDRIKKSDTYDQNYGDKLDGRIAELQKAWNDKYGHDFNLKHANKLFGQDFAAIQQAQVGNNSDVETLVKALGGDDSDLQSGRGIAVMAVSADAGLPALKVPLIHELPDSWKIDVPNDLDAAKLRQSLLDHLTALGQHTADWPANETDAYRVVAHHVLMAVLDKPVDWKGENPSADTSK